MIMIIIIIIIMIIIIIQRNIFEGMIWYLKDVAFDT